jgi:predicted phage terminase large subunit-like protein
VKLADCRIFATVDLATTAKKQADYTVFAVWAVTPDSDLVLLDLYREQYELPAILALAYRVMDKWSPAYFAVESNGIGTPIIQALRLGTVDSEGTKRPGLAVRGIHSHAEKVERAATAIVRTEAQQVFFPAQAPWLEAFEAELLSFPDGGHDDQVDVLSLAANEVFWVGGSGIEDDERKQARLEEEKAEAERKQAEWLDPTATHWWGEDDD